MKQRMAALAAIALFVTGCGATGTKVEVFENQQNPKETLILISPKRAGLEAVIASFHRVEVGYCRFTREGSTELTGSFSAEVDDASKKFRYVLHPLSGADRVFLLNSDGSLQDESGAVWALKPGVTGKKTRPAGFTTGKTRRAYITGVMRHPRAPRYFANAA
jgi:hypothetical protein